jgi:hypothetical protein
LFAHLFSGESKFVVPLYSNSYIKSILFQHCWVLR